MFFDCSSSCPDGVVCRWRGFGLAASVDSRYYYRLECVGSGIGLLQQNATASMSLNAALSGDIVGPDCGCFVFVIRVRLEHTTFRLVTLASPSCRSEPGTSCATASHFLVASAISYVCDRVVPLPLQNSCALLGLAVRSVGPSA